MDSFIQNQDDYALVKSDIPLISNLSIVENLALIQEVHHKKTPQEAEEEVMLLLKSISLEQIARQRVPACNEFEIFCAMLIRALLSDSIHVLIVTPFSLISTLVEIHELLATIEKLDLKKDIMILDLKNNRSKYEGALCHIIE